jgi:hypothetical protein
MTSRKELGKGNLGVVIARAGVGKTAFLIHAAFDKLFRGRKIVHVALEDSPEKIASYYNTIFDEIAKAVRIEKATEVRRLAERNRMILAYLNQSFDVKRLRDYMKDLGEKVGFAPDALVVDGLDCGKAGRDLLENFKTLASEFQVEVWFSARSHRHVTDVNERGIPYPCNTIDEFFSLIVQLQTTSGGVFLKLLKDNGNPVPPETGVKLDPNTFLATV